MYSWKAKSGRLFQQRTKGCSADSPLRMLLGEYSSTQVTQALVYWGSRVREMAGSGTGLRPCSPGLTSVPVAWSTACFVCCSASNTVLETLEMTVTL